MTNKTTQPTQAFIRLERRYEAAVEDLWFLWTTKEGFESWWGPEGFRVEVHKLDLRVGGDLVDRLPSSIEVKGRVDVCSGVLAQRDAVGRGAALAPGRARADERRL